MTGGQYGILLRYIRQLVDPRCAGDRTDGQLLEAFASRQDPAAFEALLQRHAALVWSVCRRLLADEHAAEDAFQATFLVLVRKAATLDRRGSLGNWLYTVAYHLALKARARSARQRTREREVADMHPTQTTAETPQGELNAVLDEELQGLPARYRQPLVLCYLQGKTNEEAALELGCPAGSMSRHLARGRDLLRERLTRRGVALSTSVLVPVLAESARAAPASLVHATVQAGLLYAAGKSAAGVLSTEAVALAEGFLKASTLAHAKVAAALIFTIGLLGAGASVLAYHSLNDSPPSDPAPGEQHRLVAASKSPAAPATDGGLAADIDRQVEDWLPTREERRMDEIGWARDLREARQLAQEHGRPIFVLTHTGNVALGRCCGGSSHMRASGFGNDEVIRLLNRCYVPVYVSNENYARQGGVPPEEKREFDRIYHESAKQKLAVGSNTAYVLSPAGQPLGALHGCSAAQAGKLLELLERHVCDLDIPETEPIIPPAPQSRPPTADHDALVLHLTARYLIRQGEALVPLNIRLGQDRDYSWNAFPAESWIVLPREQWLKLLPARAVKAGQSWMLDPELTQQLLRHFYPATEENDLAKNRIDAGSLQATVVMLDRGQVRARLEGRLRMKHRFVETREDDRFVEAQLLGYLDFDPAGPRIRSMRLYTPQASYGDEPFGVAVRSLP